jgi:crossover junction endodeoxyribonuclease RuvC
MIVIGIDPGTIRTGYGILRRDGGRIIRLTSGTIHLDNKAPVEERLVPLQDELDRVLVSHGPDEAAVESLFFSKNAMSALKLGHARGVILLTLSRHNLSVSSYAPALVKRSVVGGGRAAKGQVAKVVQAILGLRETPQEDEADALAIAICHLNAPKIPTTPPG